MAKHLLIKSKLVSKLLSSFKSCRPKHPSSLPFNPIRPSSLPINTRHVSSPPPSSPSSHSNWLKQRNWHVIAFHFSHNYHFTPPRPKIYASSSSADDLRRAPRRRRRRRKSEFPSPTPARLSEFMRKASAAEVAVVEGKVRESYAVVKRSEDPYVDFRRSMAEMVVEKQMFDKNDMEELLRCFLTINSDHLHGVIVRAFVDIWDDLFCRRPNNNKLSRLSVVERPC